MKEYKHILTLEKEFKEEYYEISEKYYNENLT